MKRIILAAIFVTPFLLNAQVKEQPLDSAAIKKENAATAIEEKKVAKEKSEAEIALEQGKEIVVRDTTQVYSATSIAENSGFGRTVAFDGVWKVAMDLDKNELIITGGTIQNLTDKASNPLRMMVYYANAEFNTAKPDLIGTVFSSADVEAIPPKGKTVNQSYITKIALDSPPSAGKYYPYIVLGELNPQTQQYEVIDVKVFKEFVSLP